MEAELLVLRLVLARVAEDALGGLGAGADERVDDVRGDLVCFVFLDELVLRVELEEDLRAELAVGRDFREVGHVELVRQATRRGGLVEPRRRDGGERDEEFTHGCLLLVRRGLRRLLGGRKRLAVDLRASGGRRRAGERSSERSARSLRAIRRDRPRSALTVSVVYEVPGAHSVAVEATPRPSMPRRRFTQACRSHNS